MSDEIMNLSLLKISCVRIKRSIQIYTKSVDFVDIFEEVEN